MSKTQMDWLCEHLGHTMDVHKVNYRSRSDITERVEIAKLLLIQDFGVSRMFVGKRLEEIQLRLSIVSFFEVNYLLVAPQKSVIVSFFQVNYLWVAPQKYVHSVCPSQLFMGCTPKICP